MDEIARTAQFTKRTLYQYFATKEALYYAVALREFQGLISQYETAAQAGKTGFEKITDIGRSFFRLYQESRGIFRLISHCRFLNADDPTNPGLQAMARIENTMLQLFVKTIEEGKRDGSIRPDLDAEKGAFFVVTVSIGLLNMISEINPASVKYPVVTQSGFVDFAFELLSDAIRAKQTKYRLCKK